MVCWSRDFRPTSGNEDQAIEAMREFLKADHAVEAQPS